MTTRVGYLVLAHRAPRQAARLTRQLCAAGDQVFLHVDRRSDLGTFEDALREPLSDGLIRLANRRLRSRWASYALVQAALGMLEQALQETPAHHFCLLSGDSYPLVSAASLRAFLQRAGDRSFLFHDDGHQVQRPDRRGNATWYWNGDLRRVTYRHYQIGDRQIHLPNRYLPWVPRLAPPSDMALVQGSQWWTLSRPAARFLVESFVRRPDLHRYFRRVQAPDEWAVQMALTNSPWRSQIVNDDLHFIAWEDWHARMLDRSDLDQMRGSAKLFARKVSAENHAVTDALDAMIASEDSATTVARLARHHGLD